MLGGMDTPLDHSSSPTQGHTLANACASEPGQVLPVAATAGRAAAGGGGSPVGVTRGESTGHSPQERPEVGQIDWLAFTLHPAQGKDWRWVRSCLAHVFGIVSESWQGTGKSWSGYKHRVDLIHPSDRGESLNLGLVAWGGESQKGTVHVSLNAQACARIIDWEEIRSWGESTGSVITRVDVAHDDFEGVTVNIDQARQWYATGGFNSNGRPPGGRLIDDLDSGKGKTFYVGNRSFGKLCRVYEKGKEEGDPLSPWCRVEVEWRNKGREITWNVVTAPGIYIAGAYPCLYYLSEHQEKIKTIRKAASIQYPHMVAWVKSAAGRALNVINQVEGGDAEAVLKQVLRDGAPKRLEPFTGWPGMLEEVAHADDESP